MFTQRGRLPCHILVFAAAVFPHCYTWYIYVSPALAESLMTNGMVLILQDPELDQEVCKYRSICINIYQ